MSKTTKQSDPRVVVRPRSSGDYGSFSIGGDNHTFKEKFNLCNDIKDQILRHVNDTGSNYIDVEWDDNVVCEYCDADWSEDSDVFNGGCCSQDIENEPTD